MNPLSLLFRLPFFQVFVVLVVLFSVLDCCMAADEIDLLSLAESYWEEAVSHALGDVLMVPLISNGKDHDS